MTRESFAKFVFFGLMSVIIGVTGTFAQDQSCGLKIETMRNDDESLIIGATATAVNTETNKIYRSNLRKGTPFFAKLSEGEYKITVTKVGYKKSVDNYVVTCVQMEDGVITTSIPMWQGSLRQIVSVSEEYQTTEPPRSGVKPDGDSGQQNEIDPSSINGGVLNGKATNLVKPPYPAAARAVNARGVVNVQVTIDEQGNVISASAVSGHPLLRSAAVQAARASKFLPTLLSGQPVKVTGVIVYSFFP